MINMYTKVIKIFQENGEIVSCYRRLTEEITLQPLNTPKEYENLLLISSIY